MTDGAILIFLAAFLAVLALLQLWAPGAVRTGKPRDEVESELPGWMRALPLLGARAASNRILRAGGPTALTPRTLGMARVASACLTLATLFPVTALFPIRAAPLTLVGALCLGLALPDLLLEWLAARRRQEIVGRLPDAIDVLAIAAAGGRSVRAAMVELQRAGSGPLATELAITVAELEAGRSTAGALAGLRRRVPGPELAALTAAIERSARFGSPLVDELHRQTGRLREQQGRRIAERAARAGPKIQLVIALVLVPSVLLLVAAALVANADRLLAF